jgi:hypothetical protein
MTRIQSALALLRSPAEDVRVGSRFRIATYALIALGVFGAGLTLMAYPAFALLIAAVLCGWSEVSGLCGSSHVLAITPLRALDPSRNLWRKAALAYTFGGIATSALMGAGLGALGVAVGVNTSHALIPIALLAVTLAAREFGLINFRLPQVRRQTNKMWAFEFGFVPAAGMWGAHIGLGFATVIAHGGFFALVCFAAILGPPIASAIMIAYWLGRALPICIGPALTPSDAALNSESILKHPAAYSHAAAAGLIIAAAFALRLM